MRHGAPLQPRHAQTRQEDVRGNQHRAGIPRQLPRPWTASADTGVRAMPGAGGGGRQFRGAEVVLHVYDLSPLNSYIYEFGVGAFHSGVEVSGTEYTYGGHERQASGIFTHAPKAAPNAAYRSVFKWFVVPSAPL